MLTSSAVITIRKGSFSCSEAGPSFLSGQAAPVRPCPRASASGGPEHLCPAPGAAVHVSGAAGSASKTSYKAGLSLRDRENASLRPLRLRLWQGLEDPLRNSMLRLEASLQ